MVKEHNYPWWSIRRFASIDELVSTSSISNLWPSILVLIGRVVSKTVGDSFSPNARKLLHKLRTIGENRRRCRRDSTQLTSMNANFVDSIRRIDNNIAIIETVYLTGLCVI